MAFELSLDLETGLEACISLFENVEGSSLFRGPKASLQPGVVPLTFVGINEAALWRLGLSTQVAFS